MKVTLELDITHVTGGRDDPDRVADILFWRMLDCRIVAAGHRGEAQYLINGYRLVDCQSETEDGNEIDVLADE